jgi:type VI secretion system protein ImpK
MILNHTITKYKELWVKMFFNVVENSVKRPICYMRQKNAHNFMNIIILEASDLLYLITLLRQNKIEELTDKTYHSILETIEGFVKSLENYHFSIEQIDHAKYLICAAIDEAAAKSKDINIALEIRNKGFVNYFYKEELGGEKFFKIIDSLSDDIEKNYSLIRLAYILLLLGFQGKHGIIEQGLSILNDIQNQLYLSISHYEKYLLAARTSVNQHNNRLESPTKLFASYIFVAFVVYVIFYTVLDSKSKHVVESLTTQLNVEK